MHVKKVLLEQASLYPHSEDSMLLGRELQMNLFRGSLHPYTQVKMVTYGWANVRVSGQMIWYQSAREGCLDNWYKSFFYFLVQIINPYC